MCQISENCDLFRFEPVTHSKLHSKNIFSYWRVQNIVRMFESRGVFRLQKKKLSFRLESKW